MEKKKILMVFGTRPEAIKMCPLYLKLKSDLKDVADTKLCVTGQHKEMLKQVLDIFDVKPDYDLAIMKEKQTIFDITTNILNSISSVLDAEKPDLVLVHGDTSTTFVTALACFYKQIAVGHVEAGLRTGNIYSPFPEEFNRRGVSIISALNFAPTETAKQNLLKEGTDPKTIFVTGNTVIDAMKTTVKKDVDFDFLDKTKRTILLTAHRRENLGEPLREMFTAIKRIVHEFDDVEVVYPIHLNPVVRDIAKEIFGDEKRVKLIEPLGVSDFHNLISKSYLIMTDSGGIQEEAPSLNKPVLVMRDTTERPEGVEAGTLRLVGTDQQTIYENAKELLTNKDVYNKMANAKNPYGDGTACDKIIDAICKHFDVKPQRIPKVLHYIWVGGKPKPQQIVDYLNSWKKVCPDYEIVEWNESNLDIDSVPFAKEAYKNKKWAFVTDYFRLWILYNYGGIYMDTDVELVKPLDEYLCHHGFSGFENDVLIPTAVMGAEKGNRYIKWLLDYYDGKHFENPDGSLDTMTNVRVISAMTKVKFDIALNNTYQEIDDGNFVYYPHDYFCPKDYVTQKINSTENTHAIHHFTGTWLTQKSKKLDKFVAGLRKVLGAKFWSFVAKKFLLSEAKKDIKNLKKNRKELFE